MTFSVIGHCCHTVYTNSRNLDGKNKFEISGWGEGTFGDATQSDLANLWSRAWLINVTACKKEETEVYGEENDW